MKKTILAVGAHIGDMELSAGGMLASEAIKGNRVILCALTAGEKGAPSGVSVEAYKKTKIRESEAGAKLLGGKSIVFSDNEDGLLGSDERTIWRLVDIIRSEKPDVIVTHWKNSVHKDHEMCSRITSMARYYASNAFERELPPFPVAKMFFAENLEDKKDFIPFVYVDISDGYELWKKLIHIHQFAFTSKDHRYWEYYDALSIIRGEESKFKHAEAFMVREGFEHINYSSIFEF